MRSGLKEIAQELGVSISTVSRAVNNKDNVSEEMKQKVQRAIAKHNYRPNQVARALRTQTTNTVAIVVPDIGEYFSEVIKGADRILAEKGYSILLVDTHESKQIEENALEMLCQKCVDGIILATVNDSEGEEFGTELEMNGIQTVFFDNVPNKKNGYNIVLLDNFKSSIMAVDHLVEQGHSRIAFLCGNLRETVARDRWNGFLSAMYGHNLEVDYSLMVQCSYDEDEAYKAAVELLRRREAHPFSAIYASTYKFTRAVIQAIKDNGLSYPDDIGLMGFDLVDNLGIISPKITSIVQPAKKIGQAVASILLGRIADTSSQPAAQAVYQHTVMEPLLVVGDSSKKVKS